MSMVPVIRPRKTLLTDPPKKVQDMILRCGKVRFSSQTVGDLTVYCLYLGSHQFSLKVAS